MSNITRLLTDVTTNTTGSYVAVPEGGYYIAEAEGTWNGASVTFTSKGAQKGNAIPVKDTTGTVIALTSDDQRPVWIGTAEQVSANVTSAGGSTNLSVSLKKVRDVR